MADGNGGGAYITTREVYNLLTEVRDEVLLLKKEYWLKAESDQKENARRDRELVSLKSRWYGTLGVFGGFTASLIAILVKG